MTDNSPIKKYLSHPKVVLLDYINPTVSVTATRTCWGSLDKMDSKDDELGPKDRELLDRVGNKYRHGSVLEHLVFSFHVKDVSRALLQEHSRHRMASISVRSSRYTIKELRDEKAFITVDKFDFERASKYVVFTGNETVDTFILENLENLRFTVVSGASNDIVKYTLPEAYKTEFVWTVNARSLQNYLKLRTHKSALWEIRNLAYAVFEAIPEDLKYLFEEYVYKGEHNGK